MGAGTGTNPRLDAMRRLQVFLPWGATDERSRMYLDSREMQWVDLRDLREAIERLKVVSNSKNFPGLRVIVTACEEAAADRRKAERANADASSNVERSRLPTPQEIEEAQQIRALGRVGVFYCDTCRAFVRAEKGKNRGWNPCHYESNRALWAARKGRPIPYGATQAAFSKYQPPLVKTKRAARRKRGTDLTPLCDEFVEPPF